MPAFIAVAEQRSFTKAAAQVGIALPSISLITRDRFLQTWRFSRADQHAEIAVDGSLIVNHINLVLNAALGGIGIARGRYQGPNWDMFALGCRSPLLALLR